MDRWEEQAAGFLASYLTMANTAEFLNGIDRILDECDEERLSATEALWQIRKLRQSMTSSNIKLRSLSRGDDRPPGGSDGRLLPGAPS